MQITCMNVFPLSQKNHKRFFSDLKLFRGDLIAFDVSQTGFLQFLYQQL